MTSYYDDDPWAAFDPEAQQILKSVFEHEWSQRSEPFIRAEQDRNFKAAEDRVRAIYGDTYEKHRAAILRFAVDNEIPNIEIALQAWRGSQGQPEARSAKPESGGLRADREKLEARLEDLKYRDGDGAERERADLKRAIDDVGDRELEATMREANEDGDAKTQVLSELNSIHDQRNRQRTDLAAAGMSPERLRGKSTAESRLEMDAQALDIIRGGTIEPTKPARQSRFQREVDKHGFDARDRAVLSRVMRDNATSDAERAEIDLNAEDIIRDVIADQ